MSTSEDVEERTTGMATIDTPRPERTERAEATAALSAAHAPRGSEWRKRLRRLARDRRIPISTAFLLLVVFTALVGPALAPYDDREMNVAIPLTGPSSEHLMGVDNFGRDLFTRIIYGSRISLMAAVVVALGAMLIGLPIGLLTGYFGGWVDIAVMRPVDMLLSFPWILVAMAIATIAKPGFTTVLIALIVVYAPGVARLARSVVLSEREREYVEAARVAGASTPSIMLRHILPNISSPLLVQAISIMSFAILAEASLSYLGLGTQPPTASWGLMLAEGGFYMSVAGHMSIFPGVAIVLFVLMLTLLGDALRDELDPRSRLST